MAQFLRVTADAWAATKTEEAGNRALERVRFMCLLERGAGLALHDAVGKARRSGDWLGIEHFPTERLPTVRRLTPRLPGFAGG